MHVMTVEEAERIVQVLRGGQRFCYYRGFLACDRDPMLVGPEKSRGVAALCDLMLKHGCPANYPLGSGVVVEGLGSGSLSQRRLGVGDYEYLFTKRQTKRGRSLMPHDAVYIHGQTVFASQEAALSNGAPVAELEEVPFADTPVNGTKRRVIITRDHGGPPKAHHTAESAVRALAHCAGGHDRHVQILEPVDIH